MLLFTGITGKLMKKKQSFFSIKLIYGNHSHKYVPSCTETIYINICTERVKSILYIFNSNGYKNYFQRLLWAHWCGKGLLVIFYKKFKIFTRKIFEHLFIKIH